MPIPADPDLVSDFDAVTLTFVTTTGATVTAQVQQPDGTLLAAVSVSESPAASGEFPFTFLPDAPGMWGVVFRASGVVTAVEQRWVRARALATVPPLAAVEDIARGWRGLTSDEETVVAALIDHASLIVRAKIPTVDSRLADGSLSADLVAAVVAGMVRDVLDSPPVGMQSWTVDDYTERFYEVERRLTLHPADLDLLALPGALTGAFTIRPHGPARTGVTPWH